MIKSIKVMLLPNNKQNTKMFETSNAARYAYNWTVALQMNTFNEIGKYTQNQWLYKVSNNATKQAIKDCCEAFWRFIKKKKDKNYKPYSKKQIAHAAIVGKILTRYDMQHHPKFKKKSKTEPKFYIDTAKIKFTETHVKQYSVTKRFSINRTSKPIDVSF